MTIAELIKALQAVPEQHARAQLFCDDGQWHYVYRVYAADPE